MWCNHVINVTLQTPLNGETFNGVYNVTFNSYANEFLNKYIKTRRIRNNDLRFVKHRSIPLRHEGSQSLIKSYKVLSSRVHNKSLKIITFYVPVNVNCIECCLLLNAYAGILIEYNFFSCNTMVPITSVMILRVVLIYYDGILCWQGLAAVAAEWTGSKRISTTHR